MIEKGLSQEVSRYHSRKKFFSEGLNNLYLQVDSFYIRKKRNINKGNI